MDGVSQHVLGLDDKYYSQNKTNIIKQSKKICMRNPHEPDLEGEGGDVPVGLEEVEELGGVGHPEGEGGRVGGARVLLGIQILFTDIKQRTLKEI